MMRMIRKRDGVTTQPFDEEKIRRAVSKAWSCQHPLDAYGWERVEHVVRDVLTMLPSGDFEVTVEQMQDLVEVALMRAGHYPVAKHYILYRESRATKRKLRDAKPDPKAISDYIHAGKYARYRPDLGRREVYAETVTRCADMHLRRFPQHADMIAEAFQLVYEQRVLPSMRSMQFAGPAIESNHCKIYNCSFGYIDRLRAFSEGLYLLLCGCGVGYSVQREHVEKLPPIGRINDRLVRHHIVGDTIEGWADAVEALFQGFQDGVYVEFAYHQVRDAGSPLRTSGGKAPGHWGLKASLEAVRGILMRAQGRRLEPVECHRIMCMLAEAPLSGGVRRSAMIALFSSDDNYMRDIKTGNWIKDEPYLQNANNSVVFKRGEVREKQFKRIFDMIRQWGEPGFYFTSDPEYGTNPCGEIGLYPKLVIDAQVKARLAKRDIQVEIGDVYSGWAFCNLCEINASKLTSLDDFMAAAKAATFIGTLQATYTKMPYLGWVSEMLAEREALLGVGMTGILDAPSVACNPEYQRKVAARIKLWNREFAAMLGINPAARTTCVKPSGTASLELGCIGSGHHAHHARRYIRRVVADELEPVFQAFRKQNPHMCVRKPDGKWVIEFPVEAPAGATVKGDLDAINFLEMVKSTQQNWVIPGTGDSLYAPDLTHNVSNTVQVKDSEWSAVAAYLWANRSYFTGVSLLPDIADKKYPFAPNEAVTTEADEARFNQLIAEYQPLDYSTLREEDDSTSLRAEAACANGACEVHV